ncbi:hypothetical protein ACFUIZ_18760 [Streptomyces cinereoruber]|uniref:hypothetical protein n=1 Tax=Streptomyces cinereoruber TaxID=67260 RepID=UPI00362F13CB
MAMNREGELLLLLSPNLTPERLRDDLTRIFGHLIGDGLLVWNGEQAPTGLP